PQPKPEPPKPAPTAAAEKPAPTPPKAVTPRPAAPTSPPKRKGIVRGNPLGASSSATVGVEDPNFTYGYYLDRVLAAISENWVRPPVGGGLDEALLAFRILENGQITELRLATSSGSDAFDRAAMRAIEASTPLPPLPRGYKKDYLGIQLVVR
ncbi:MAG: energy transducer TonB, partial [Acidobacteriota bacterium]